MNRHHAYLPLALLTTVVLTACGGGGSSSSPAAAQPSSVEALSITTANYESVASAAGSSAAQLSDSYSRSKSASGIVGVEVSSGHWMAGLRGVLHTALYGQPIDNTLVGVVQQSTMNCEAGGTLTASYDDAQQGEGRTVTISMAECKELDGSKSNGTLVVKVTKVDADNQPTEMTLSFSNYSYTEGAVTYALGGSMFLKELTDLYMVSSSELRMTAKGGTVNESEVWTNFNYFEDTSVVGVRKISFSGKLASSELNNKSVTLNVTKPFEFVGTADVPNAGALLITGEKNSVVSITVKDEVSPVTLSVDEDGDGKIDRTTTKSWTDIAGSDFN